MIFTTLISDISQYGPPSLSREWVYSPEHRKLLLAGQTFRKLFIISSSTSKVDDNVLFQGQKASSSPNNGK
jgi:hypothetical protein